MSTNSTGPEEKGFFEKVKETIEELWEGTKDKAEEIKDAAEDKFEDLKDKVTAKKTTAKKKPAQRKKAVSTKVKSVASDAKAAATGIKAKAETKAKEITTKAKKEVADVKARAATKAERGICQNQKLQHLPLKKLLQQKQVAQNQRERAKRKLRQLTKGNQNCNNDKRRPGIRGAFIILLCYFLCFKLVAYAFYGSYHFVTQLFAQLADMYINSAVSNHYGIFPDIF